MNVKERLQRYIDYIGIPVRAFERTVGFSYGYVANIRKSIQPDKTMSIAKHFPDLNIGWLLTGEGEMLRGGQEKPQGQKVQVPGELDVRGLIESFKDVAAAAKAATQTAQSLASSVECLLARLDDERAPTATAMSVPGPVMRAAQ